MKNSKNFPSKIGNSVHFQPKGLVGTVIDEILVYSQPFMNCAQLIEWENGDNVIRFCYYKKVNDKWVFARRSLTLDIPDLKIMISKMLKKDWI